MNDSENLDSTENKIYLLQRELIYRYNPDFYSENITDGSLNKDELKQYHEIEQKLYQDVLYITSITHILRDPLRDQLSVEQSSRYKSILGKLIKSI
jgi:hypothetical protein